MIAADAVICTSCGRQVEEIRQQQEQPQIVINNSNCNVNANTNTNTNTNAAVAGGKLCNKWVSFWLCLLLGVFGAHKFYEGKPLMGILYLCTMGLAFLALSLTSSLFWLSAIRIMHDGPVILSVAMWAELSYNTCILILRRLFNGYFQT